MKFISEETGKIYDTMEECEKADKEVRAARKKEEEEKIKLENEKKGRMEEVKAAYQLAVKAEEDYERLSEEFYKDYGYYRVAEEPERVSSIRDLMSIFKLLNS